MADIRAFASAPAPSAPPAVTGRAADDRLLNELLELLSHLEQHRAQLVEQAATQGDPSALARVAELLNQVVAFVVARTNDSALLPSRVLSRVADAMPYTQLLGEDQERITVATAMAALNEWKGDVGDRRVLLRDLCAATVDLLEMYCDAIATLFRVERDREEWRTMSQLFVTDLRNTFR